MQLAAKALSMAEMVRKEVEGYLRGGSMWNLATSKLVNSIVHEFCQIRDWGTGRLYPSEILNEQSLYTPSAKMFELNESEHQKLVNVVLSEFTILRDVFQFYCEVSYTSEKHQGRGLI